MKWAMGLDVGEFALDERYKQRVTQPPFPPPGPPQHMRPGPPQQMPPPGPPPSAVRVPGPLRSTPLADRLVRPYRMGPWCAGTMITGAFIVIPLVTAVTALSLAKAVEAGGLNALPADERSRATGGLAIAGILIGYVAIASIINAVRFRRLRQRVEAYYAQLGQLARRSPQVDRDIAAVVRDDGELYGEDKRRHVLLSTVSVFSIIAALLGDGASAADSGPEDAKGPRAGQFGWKLFWGIVLIGGGAVGLFLLDSPTTDTRVAAAIYLGLNLLWLIPTLCRSVALRGVERAWRGGLRNTYAALRNELPKWLRAEKA